MSTLPPCCRGKYPCTDKYLVMPTTRAILFFCLLFPARLLADPLGPAFALIPAPQRIEPVGGRGLLYRDLLRVEVENAGQARLLSGYPASLPVRVLVGDEAAGVLSLRIDSMLELPSPEGYVL